MPSSYYMPMEVFNGIILALFAIIPVTFLVITRRADWGQSRLYPASVRARMPIGSERMAQSIAARTRTVVRANMWGVMSAIVIVASMFALTPLGASPNFLWFLSAAILLGVIAISQVVVTVRERLFTPAPSAPRMARATALRVGDYLRPAERFAPWALSAILTLLWAIIALLWGTGRVEGGALGWLIAGTIFALVGGAAGMWAERRILVQPQPASTTLELAWDDLFRADALRTLRMAETMLVWIPLGIGGSLLLHMILSNPSPEAGSIMQLFPWWGIPFIQVLYTWGAGRLPAALRPDVAMYSSTIGEERTA